MAEVEPADSISLEELRGRLRKAEPSARLAPSRILRRVIKHDRAMSVFALRVPHRKTYVISRTRLLAVVDPEELGYKSADEVPTRLLLLAEPQPGRFDSRSAQDLLERTWRLLFHARLDAAMQDRLEAGLSEGQIRSRVDAIGQVAFDEIRAVLRDELFLFAPFDHAAVYAEFVAVFCELRYFRPWLLKRYFPSLEDVECVASLVDQDVDAEQIFIETRLAGAALPRIDFGEEEALRETPPLEDVAESQADEAYSPTSGRSLQARAKRAESVGNTVRAAITYTRLAAMAPGKTARSASQSAARQLDQLARRLQAALGFEPEQFAAWRSGLEALVAQTRQGFWSVEARMLYDLQKICLNHEHETYTIDVLSWALSCGKRPIRRPLPQLRQVLVVRHLRSASQRLNRTRLRDTVREAFEKVLSSAEKRAEKRLRQHLRPVIESELEAVHLRAENVPEQVGRSKLLDEVLDRIVSRGFLSMADLRDALARNQLKLPDLPRWQDVLAGRSGEPATAEEACSAASGEAAREAGNGEAATAAMAAATPWRGATNETSSGGLMKRMGLLLVAPILLLFRRDRLLQLDKRLDVSLDGVYRAGEIYLRWLQRFSSLLYGTPVGRLITKYLIIPFGGAMLVLYGPELMLHEFFGIHVPLYNVWSGTAGGLFIYLLIYHPQFRQGVVEGLTAARTGFRRLVVQPIAWLMRLQIVRIILASQPLALVLRFFVKPALIGALIWLLLPYREITFDLQVVNYLGIFLAVNFLVNSRTFRTLEERFYDALVTTWNRIRWHWLAGLFRLVMDLFNAALESVERFIYFVDERLRFRSGDPRLTTIAKGLASPVWITVSYLIRSVVNVLIEPQVNPIKHFPVVTISHKFLIPLQPMLASLLMLSMNRVTAELISGTVVLVAPGAIGFLVWELKENWRIYAANRPKILLPIRIGDHGETMLRFLRPGIHSGTIPKLFSRLRRAERRARYNGNWRPVRKHLAALHHAEHTIAVFMEREFLPLVRRATAFNGLRLYVGEARAGSNNVRIWIWLAGDEEAGPLELQFQERSALVVVGIQQLGWLAGRTPEQKSVVRDALLGVYKYAGVNLVREQIAQCLPPKDWTYDVAHDALLVWPTPGGDVQFEYRFDVPGNELKPETVAAPPEMTLPTLRRDEIVFHEVPVVWGEWVRLWDERASGRAVAGLLPQVTVLPQEGEESANLGRATHSEKMT